MRNLQDEDEGRGLRGAAASLCVDDTSFRWAPLDEVGFQARFPVRASEDAPCADGLRRHLHDGGEVVVGLANEARAARAHDAEALVLAASDLTRLEGVRQELGRNLPKRGSKRLRRMGHAIFYRVGARLATQRGP